MKIILILFGLLVFNPGFGQDQEKYLRLISEAEILYDNTEYLKSGDKYSEAFVSYNKCIRPYDRYNAACSWALANQIDSAFVQLLIISTKNNYSDLGYLITDSDLNSLHTNYKWNDLIKVIQINKEKAEENLNKHLVNILDTIYQDDQRYRQQIEAIEEKFGRESEQIKAHWEKINEMDSINLIKTQKLLDEYGWLGSDVIGEQGNVTLFLVIQHSQLEIQEKYLPVMREAVKKGCANPSNLALLEDRVALSQGKRQIYGSQIGFDQKSGEYYVLPLDDPENVDKRRAEVELGKLEYYVLQWHIIWDVEKYKKNLSKIETKHN